MANPLGPLGPADERFDHQIADTFATVGVSDPSWTEKVCAMAARRDGGLQLGFGMGKYINRNVLDGYAGVSRGAEQVTVRASRRLFPDPETSAVGPIRYEVLEPMQRVRFSLEPNECQPLAFDWVYEAVLPPAAEDRTHQRTPLGYRVSAELVRYHQIGTASGWVELDGDRHEITPEEWVSTRDHSWGVRYDVGTPPDRHGPVRPGGRDGLPDDLVPRAHGRSRRHSVGAVHAPGGDRGVRAPPPHGDGRRRARRRDGGPDGRHPPRPVLRPGQPPPLGGSGGGDHGGRCHSAVRARGADRHGLPPGRRPVLRVAGPPPRRVARRAPCRRRAAGRLP